MDFIKKLFSDTKSNEEYIDIIRKALEGLKESNLNENILIGIEKINIEVDDLERKINNKSEILVSDMTRSSLPAKPSIFDERHRRIDVPQQRGGFEKLYDKYHN